MVSMAAVLDSALHAAGFNDSARTYEERLHRSKAEDMAARCDQLHSMQVNAALRHYSMERAARAAADCN